MDALRWGVSGDLWRRGTEVHLIGRQLGTDTWFYAKRCFLSLLENMSKHMLMLRDSVVQECVQFLEHCEGAYGEGGG